MRKLFSRRGRAYVVTVVMGSVLAALLASTHGYAASSQTPLKPAGDVAVSNVQGVSGGATSSTNV